MSGAKRESSVTVAWPQKVYECRACRAKIVVHENPNGLKPPPRTLCSTCLARTFARARLH